MDLGWFPGCFIVLQPKGGVGELLLHPLGQIKHAFVIKYLKRNYEQCIGQSPTTISGSESAKMHQEQIP